MNNRAETVADTQKTDDTPTGFNDFLEGLLAQGVRPDVHAKIKDAGDFSTMTSDDWDHLCHQLFPDIDEE